jgi:hypothetical protein
LGRSEFSLAETYAHHHELARLHPQNRYVRDKIPQQLQQWRDLRFLELLGRGQYGIIKPGAKPRRGTRTTFVTYILGL